MPVRTNACGVSNLSHAHNKGSQSTTGCANYATWPENASLRHVATAAMPNRCWTNSFLKDRDLQLKLLDVGPTITIDQAISTARTCETSKLLAEQLKTGASVQGIKSKSTYQRQKSVKVTAAAAAAVKTDAPTKPIGATCDNCGYEIRPGGHTCPARNEKCRTCKSIGHFKSVCKGKISAIHFSNRKTIVVVLMTLTHLLLLLKMHVNQMNGVKKNQSQKMKIAMIN